MSLKYLYAEDDADVVCTLISNEIAERDYNDFQLRYQLKEYYAATATSTAKDLSIVVLDKGKVCAFVLANNVDGKLGYFGQPLFFQTCTAAATGEGRVAKTIFKFYLEQARQAGSELEIVSLPRADGTLAPIAREALDQGAEVEPRYRAVVDLQRAETDLWREVRKSYRSLINWGRETMTTRYHTAANITDEVFECFRAFHAQIAGKVTRPKKSWQAQLDLLREGRAELLTCHSDDQLMAATLVNFNRSYSSYSSGVYDREKFDRPISHWPVYCAILRARERGGTMFDLGDVLLNSSSDKKQLNIAFFKKGFTDRIEVQTLYRLRPC